MSIEMKPDKGHRNGICNVTGFQMKPDKGHRNGSCNVTGCQRPGATFYNKATQKYYCSDCAGQINWSGGRNDAMRLFGYPYLCEHIPEGMEPGEDGRPTPVKTPEKVWESWDDHLEETASRVPDDEARLIDQSAGYQQITFRLSNEVLRRLFLVTSDTLSADDVVEDSLRIFLMLPERNPQE